MLPLDTVNNDIIGLIPLDGNQAEWDMQSHIGYVDVLIAVAEERGIEVNSPDLPVTKEQIESAENDLIARIISEITESDSYSNSNKALKIVLNTIVKSGINLDSKQYQQLTGILSDANYSESRDKIYKILISSEYKPEQEEITALMPLLEQDNSLYLIELLIKKDGIDKKLVTQIIDSISNADTTISVKSLYKEQLLKIAANLYKHTELKENIQDEIVEFVDSYADIPFVAELVRGVNDDNFFSSINEKVTQNLNQLTNLFAVEKELKQIIELQKETRDVDLSYLKELLSRENIMLTNSAKNRIVALDNIETDAKSYSTQGVAKKVTGIIQKFSYVVRSSININTELLKEYEQFLMSELPSSIGSNNINSIFERNIHNCLILLNKGNILSEDCANFLINKIAENINKENPAHITEIIRLISTFASSGKINGILKQKSALLLENILELDDKQVQYNLLQHFNSFVKADIVNDTLISDLCNKYAGKIKYADKILDSLEIMQSHGNILPEAAFSFIIGIVLEKDKLPVESIDTPKKALSLLKGSVTSLTEQNISDLAVILDKALSTQSAGELSEGFEYTHYGAASVSSISNYSISCAVMQLFANYASFYKTLPEIAVNILTSKINSDAVENIGLTNVLLQSLGQIAIINPDLFDQEVIEYIKSGDSVTANRIELNSYLAGIAKLLDNLKANSDNEDALDALESTRAGFIKAIEKALGAAVDLLFFADGENFDKLYELLGKTLKTAPELYDQCFDFIIQTISTQQNSDIVDLLIELNKLSYEELFGFASLGCYSPLLKKHVEDAFLENIEVIKSDRELVKEVLAGVKNLTIEALKEHDTIAGDVVSGLIELAIIYPDQRLNILRTIYLSSSNLEDNHFNKLEDLLSVLKIEDSSNDLLDIIASLFTINHKVISNQSSIDLVLSYLNNSSDITSNKIKLVKLLPENLQIQGNILVKLNSYISVEEKLDLIKNLAGLTSEGHDLQPQIINYLLNILSNKSLAKAVIKVLSLNANKLASILSNGKFSLNASQIICSYKEALKEEYLLLQEFIEEDVDLYIENAKEQHLRAALEKKFTDTYLTNSTLCQIHGLLDHYSDSEVFSKNVLLDSILQKADSIWEYEQFLKLINKYNISEDKIWSCHNYKNLDVIMKILSSDILMSIFEGISGYIEKHPNSNIADNVKSINNNCYELKSCGWSSAGLVNILKHLKEDSSSDSGINIKNIEILQNLFADLAKYKIAEYDKDKNGRSIFDVINSHNLDSIGSYQEVEESIYSIFNNKFVYKPENTGEILLEKLLELNPDIEDKLPEYKSVLEKVRSIYKEHGALSVNSAICDWSIDEIAAWCTEYVNRYGGNVASQVRAEASNENITGDEDESTPSKPEFDFNQDAKFDLAELIAVLQRANNIHTITEYNKKGNLLRDTQIVSLLMLLEDNAVHNGKLLQVATGEGKSAISAMLAAILALQGEKVDIVTSSRVLAKTGHENAKGFFTMLGLSCGINIDKEKGMHQKPCYRTDVVYGDSLSFQSDYLSNSSHLGERRGDREFSKVIIDEVDSMLIDGKSGLTKQTNPTPLMEFLLPVMSTAWDNFQRNILPHVSGDNSEEIIADATKMIEELIDALPIPKHLIEYAKYQADKWSRSLYMATCVWELDKDYVINKSSQGTKVINPVDKSTGVTRENTIWENGLHQFLQIKHKCRMSQEGLTCFFTSYINYFLQYDKIVGMSGTLGSEASMEFLKEIYDIELEFVPTYKDKQCIDIPPVVTTTKQEHLAAISASAIREAETHQRAVLVVCKTIREVDELCNALRTKCTNGTKIINYSRSESALYNNQIDEITEPNTIIVATALAGRGTDIKTSKTVEENGGLHVIATSITSNAREDEQIKGRTARQGNSGTYQNIILDREYYNDELFSQQTPEILVGVKNSVRDDLERESLSKATKETVPDLLAKDEIYKKFSSFYGELIRLEKSQTPKIQQLVEDFGLWLKMREDSDDIDSFINKARDKYQNGIFTNPSYVVNGQRGIGVDEDSLFKLKQAIEHDDIYNLAAHYYSAKFFLGLGKKYDSDYKSKACTELMETADRASELISYLTAMSISLAGDTENNEPLQQTTNKILFLKSFITSIQKALDSINSCPADMEVRPGGMINVKLMVPELTEEDEQEIEFIGIEEIFDAEIYKPEPKGKWWSNVFVACCGMLQMFVGICVVVTTGGAALKLGTSIFVEGLMDAYKAVRAGSKGENIDLDEYFTGKAVSYAVIGAQTKISSMNAGKELASKELANEAAKETVKEGVKEGVKDNLTHPFQELIKESAIKIGETVATQYIAEMASQAVRETVLDGLEDRMKDAISKTVDQGLTDNPILLSKAYNFERQQIMQSIKQAIMQAVKTHKHVQIINSLASGLLKATGAAHGNLGTAATAIYAVHKAGQTIDAANKIEPIIDDIKKDILDIINDAAVRAIARPKAFISVAEDDEAISLRIKNEMADSIGAMVSNILMNQIQRNVTMPLVTEAASVIVNKTVEEYRAKHNNVLKNYKKDIGVAAGDNMDSLDEYNERAATRDDFESNLDSRNAQQNRHSMTRKVSLEESKLTMEEIAQKTGQPIYLFKDQKLENIYGQDQSGTPITIGYDSIRDNYSGARFAGTISLNGPAGNIYEVIAEQTIGRYSSDDLLGMHDNVPGAFGANNRSIMLQGDMASGRFAAYQAPSSNSPFDQELINLQDRVNYYSVLAASQKQQQQSSTVEMSQETVSFLSNVFQFDNSSSSPRSTTSGSYQPSDNTDPVPVYDVARQYKTGEGQYTDSRVKQEADSFAGRAGSGSGAGSFFSRIDFSPEQSGAGIGVAETDFSGRAVTSDIAVTNTSSNRNILSELSMVQTAYANPGGAAAVAIAGSDVMLNMLTLGGFAHGARVAMPALNALSFSALKTARVAAPIMAEAVLPVTAAMIAHNASTQHADDINRYASIANNSNSEVEITAADLMAANPYGWFDESYPSDIAAVEHIAKGRALEREGKIGKAVVQSAMPVTETETSALLKGIDTSLDRPTIAEFSTHYRPKSILFTPDQSAELAELTSLPGFSPSMLKAWSESFPDDSQKLEEFSNLPGFTPIHTSVPTVETFPVHEEDISDWIFHKDYEIDHWNVKEPSIKDAPSVWQHGKFGKIYQDPEEKVRNKEIWWSKDTANHGGASEGLTPSTYKLFVKTKTEFEWIADVDATGKVIKGKAKSDIGKNIPIKEFWRLK